MNNSYKLIGVLPLLLLAIIFAGMISAGSGAINTFLVYDDASATSKTVTQGDSVNLYLIAYGHGEQLYSEKLELVSSTLIFQENVAGDQIATYTWLYTRSPYILNTAILNPGTYTLRFTAVTKTTKSSEYSELQLIILPKVVQPVCGDNKINQANEQCDAGSLNGNVCTPLYGSTCTYCSSSCTSVTLNGPYCGDNIKQTNEQCDNGLSNGQPCTPLYGSSCTYCSNTCTSVTLNGPYCGDQQCNNGETCTSCSTDCGACPPQPKCGDGLVNQANEQCDNGLSNGNVCSPLYDSSCTYCSSQCTSVTLNGPHCGDNQCNNGETCSTCSTDCGSCAPVCGNGIKEGTEQCDDHNTNNNDGCSSTCKTEVCGDNIKQTNEQCDKGVLNGNVCSPLYGSSCTYCSSQCTSVTLNGPYCGDETCNNGETCSTCSTDCGSCPVQVCHIELTKSVNNSNPKPGDVVKYTLHYKNTGNAVCTGGGVEIQDALSNYLSYKGSFTKNVINDGDSDGIDAAWYEIPGYDSSTNTLTWNAHRVSPGEEGTITFNVKILTPSQCGDFQISNFFKAWSNEENWKNSNTVNMNVNYDCPVQPKCGDNKINQANETCDDGNLVNNDGCSSTCKTEVCGDSIKQTNEQCDKGTLNGNVCSPLYGSSCTYCSSQCKNVTLNGGYCGNGIKEGSEECDDHNTINGDGCSSTCKTECPPTPKPICGDGKINQANETCDKGSLNGNVCSPLYGSSCTYCSNQCKNVTLNGGYCGNGIKEGSEECDDHNTINGDGCSSTCKTECPPTPKPVCGDNICNNGETCSTCASDCGTCPTPKPECDINHFVQFCDVNWVCSGWSECVNGIITRTCTDSNHCDTIYNKPAERSDCNATSSVLSNAYVENESANAFWIILVIILFVLLLIVIIYLLR